MKGTGIIAVLMWLPQIDAAVVQGVTKPYVVFYHRHTCTCPHHEKGHHECKHLKRVLDKLAFGLTQCACCRAYYSNDEMPQASLGHPLCPACHAGLESGLTIECDDCHMVKLESAYAHPGHTAGGSAYGFDIDSCVCAACARQSHEEFQEELAKEAEAEMAAENKLTGDCPF